MSPCSASSHTWRQHGFPDSQLQRQVPQWSWVQGANLPWPAHSLKGWTLSEHQNAKDLAKSAVSMWEVKFSPRAWQRQDLFFQSFQYRKGRGVAPQRRAAAATSLQQRWVPARTAESQQELRATARAFSTSRFSLSNPTNTHDQVQSAIKVPVTRGTECRTSEDRLPQGSQWPGPRRRPLPSSSTQYHGPKHTAGCVTVENSHRTPGTRWFLHKTLCILHCLLENKLETSSNRTWATR